MKTSTHIMGNKQTQIGSMGSGGAILYRVAMEDCGDEMVLASLGEIFDGKTAPDRRTTKHKSKSVPGLFQE